MHERNTSYFRGRRDPCKAFFRVERNKQNRSPGYREKAAAALIGFKNTFRDKKQPPGQSEYADTKRACPKRSGNHRKKLPRRYQRAKDRRASFCVAVTAFAYV